MAVLIHFYTDCIFKKWHIEFDELNIYFMLYVIATFFLFTGFISFCFFYQIKYQLNFLHVRFTSEYVQILLVVIFLIFGGWGEGGESMLNINTDKNILLHSTDGMFMFSLKVLTLRLPVLEAIFRKCFSNMLTTYYISFSWLT